MNGRTTMPPLLLVVFLIVQTFQILQVVATASIAAAALVLLVAVCRSYPRRWGIASSVFFFLYAVMQGVVVWLVVHLWREVEDGEL